MDGTAYKSFKFLETVGNLSFILNTDGVAMFKSGSQQLWPVYVIINELHPEVLESENLSKAQTSSFRDLRSFVEESLS
mgnify:CR=1 FL=1